MANVKLNFNSENCAGQIVFAAAAGMRFMAIFLSKSQQIGMARL
jgi:hypothetical protein